MEVGAMGRWIVIVMETRGVPLMFPSRRPPVKPDATNDERSSHPTGFGRQVPPPPQA